MVADPEMEMAALLGMHEEGGVISRLAEEEKNVAIQKKALEDLTAQLNRITASMPTQDMSDSVTPRALPADNISSISNPPLPVAVEATAVEKINVLPASQSHAFDEDEAVDEPAVVELKAADLQLLASNVSETANFKMEEERKAEEKQAIIPATITTADFLAAVDKRRSGNSTSHVGMTTTSEKIGTNGSKDEEERAANPTVDKGDEEDSVIEVQPLVPSSSFTFLAAQARSRKPSSGSVDEAEDTLFKNVSWLHNTLDSMSVELGESERVRRQYNDELSKIEHHNNELTSSCKLLLKGHGIAVREKRVFRRLFGYLVTVQFARTLRFKHRCKMAHAKIVGICEKVLLTCATLKESDNYFVRHEALDLEVRHLRELNTTYQALSSPFSSTSFLIQELQSTLEFVVDTLESFLRANAIAASTQRMFQLETERLQQQNQRCMAVRLTNFLFCLLCYAFHHFHSVVLIVMLGVCVCMCVCFLLYRHRPRRRMRSTRPDCPRLSRS